ncbi:MAG: hypothetical protein R3F11_20780 [Verrucomicrobiales bacterium]
MESEIPKHIYSGISRLEANRAGIAERRRLGWPYSRVAAWLRDEADTPISLTALKSFCRLRGIAKGIGETGQGSPLLPPPTPGAITAQPLQSELPAIPRKRDRGRVYDFDEGDERPFRTRINRGSA